MISLGLSEVSHMSNAIQHLELLNHSNHTKKWKRKKFGCFTLRKNKTCARENTKCPKKEISVPGPSLLCAERKSFPVHVFSPKVHTIQYIWTPRSIHKPSPISTGKRYHLSSLPFRFDPSSARMLAQPSSVPSHLPFFPSPSFVACSCHSNSLPHLVF